MAKAKNLTKQQVGKLLGFRSGLEESVAAQLDAFGVDYTYEKLKVKYIRPATEHTYTPDFQLPNGIIVETKGRFLTQDRMKHLAIKRHNPDLDIRFVFSNSKARISKVSATTYAMWCYKHGYKFADKFIPEEWVNEPAKVN